MSQPNNADELNSFQFDRRTVYVLGASRSGQAIARHCLRRGDRVFLSDNDPNQALESQTTQCVGRLVFSRGRHEAAFASAADEIVLSPGVPMNCPIVDYAITLGKPIRTTVEFVASESPAELIVVTGTSGKTTTLDVLRRLISASGIGSKIILTERRDGIGIACALETPTAEYIIAELSVAELVDVRRLAPKMLVVTSLAKSNNHEEYESYEAYVEAKLGWLSGVKTKLSILAGAAEVRFIRDHFACGVSSNSPVEFETVPNGIGSVLSLAERVRGVMKQVGLEKWAQPRPILDAIRETLLERCESIEGFAMPILNIGECKNPESLAWTAAAICSEPRIITARSMGPKAKDSLGHVIDLSQNPVAIEEAIEMWTTRASVGEQGTVVIDEVTRRKLFADGNPSKRVLSSARPPQAVGD